MEDLVGIPREILRLALAVREAADKVRQNREDCLEIQQCVSRLHRILSLASQGNGNGTGAEMIANSVVSAALGDLEGILQRALDLVTTCQRRSAVCQCFMAGKLSGQLLRVVRDIDRQLAMVNFAQVTHLIITASTRREDPAWPLALQSEEEDYLLLLHIPPTPSSEDGDHDSIRFCLEMTGAVSSSFRVFNLAELKAATNNFSREQVIHDIGGPIAVYKGVLPDGSVVAIKRSHDENDLLFPVHLLHKNVVTVLGHCPCEQGEMVVEEYMPNQTLSEMLNERSQELDWSFTLQTVRGIAEGVAYLQTMRVVHPDLKPANIFFDSHMNPKIGGFGRSKLLLEQGVDEIKTEELLGTLGNIPPEYITDGIISMKSNVFSFGVLLLRIISGMRGPVLKQHPIAWALEVWEARQMEESYDPPPHDESELNERERCIGIGLLCAQMDPCDRPTLPNVLKMLNSNEGLPTPELSGFLGIRGAEQEQPWWWSNWWNWWHWSLLEKTR